MPPQQSKASIPGDPSEPDPIWSVVVRNWKGVIDEALRTWRDQAGTDVVVHKLRVTVKRLRGLLQLLQAGMAGETWRKHDATLRDLNRRLADLRSSAVMADTRERMSGNGSFAVHEELQLEMAPVEQAADDLAAMRDVIDGLRPAGSSWKLVEKGMVETYAAGRRRFRKWGKTGDLHEAHKCRKYAKYLMFQVELIRDLDPKALGKLRKRLSKLEGQLGELNDLVDFEELQTGLRTVYMVRERQRRQAAKAARTARQVFKQKPLTFARKRLRKVIRRKK